MSISYTTATYVDATHFTVSGNYVHIFVAGRRIICNDSSEIEGTVVSSSYGGGLTTVVVKHITLTSSLTGVAASPVGPGTGGNLPEHGHTSTEGDGGQITEASISDLDKYTQAEVDALLLTVSGTTDHSVLDNLSYAASGHTGFQPAGDYATNDDLTTVSGLIPTDYISSAELTTATGTLYTVLSAEIDSDISTHTSNASAHHTRYTDEEARDAVGAALVGVGTVTVTLDDGGDTITISGSSVTGMTEHGNEYHNPDFATATDLVTVSGLIPTDFYTTGEVDTISGALNTKLDTHKSSTDHDGRYFTETECNNNFAPIAKGVTNGDSHDHNGGDGAQIQHSSLGSIGANDHHNRSHTITSTSDHTAGNWKILYSNDAGNIIELPLGDVNTFLSGGHEGEIKAAPTFSAPNHPSLQGLTISDDHTQYHNDARGDARYYTQTQLTTSGVLDVRYYTETEIDAKISEPATDNLRVGTDAGKNITTGDYNTFIGKSAGENVTVGISNTFIGFDAGIDLQEGTENTLIGVYAGTGGESIASTAIGYNAGHLKGNWNVCVGSQAGTTEPEYEDINCNVVVGCGAATTITGSNNVVVGCEAGGGLGEKGENSIIVGFKAGYDAKHNSSVIIGYQCGNGISEDDKLRIDNSATPETPLIYGDFSDHQVSIGTNVLGYGLNIATDLKVGTINAGSSDYDKFLVSDSGVVKYRTGAQVLSDIGAAASSAGVTNGDSHDHSGGDGAQINHTGLSNIGTNTHAQIDTHLGATNNPHTVTAAQVGNGTAQWNANKAQGATLPTPGAGDDSKFLQYDHDTTAFVLAEASAVSTLLELTDVPDEYEEGYFLRSTASGTEWYPGTTVSGEPNTASNLGSGTGIYAQKVGVDLQLKSLVGAGTIDITSTATEVTISGSGGMIEHGNEYHSTAFATEADLATVSGIAAGKISEISEDTTPQLGGDLDANGHAMVAADHGTAATDQVVNVCYGTGDPPTASTTTEGTLYIKYTA